MIILVFSINCLINRQLMGKYLFHPYSINHYGQHYRFLTHAFIHGDYIHLAFNCLALYGFGLQLEYGFFSNDELFDPRLGKLYYIILFTGGIYAASITEYYRNKNNPDYSSLGASGAISAILFCFILIYPADVISLFFIPMKGWVVGILLLVISIYLIWKKRKTDYTDNISHESHFWGAIFGVVFMAIIKFSVLLDFVAYLKKML